MKIVLPLRSWLLLSHLAVLALPLLALVGTGTLARALQVQARTHLQHEATALARIAAPALAGGDVDALALLGEAFAGIQADTGTRLVVADLEGRIRVASEPWQVGLLLEDLGLAIPPGAGVEVRRCTPPALCDEAGRLEVVVSAPVQADEPVGNVVLAGRPAGIAEALLAAPWRLAVAAGFALLVTIGLALASGHYGSRSLRALSRASRLLGEGAAGMDDGLDRPERSHLAEVAELARDLRGMSGRLRERLAYIQEFASNVAHEFRTPITTLRGTVELIRDDVDMPPEQRSRFLGNALADLERTERLVGGLLALARVEGDRGRRAADLDAMAENLRQTWPSLRVDGRVGEVVCHPEQVESALRNLVGNAYAHGGDGVTVTLHLERSGGFVVVDVVDDGPGITPANLPRVFDRFFTTGRARGCAGLGLALVRAIARAHGGDVVVESRPGRTRFRWTLVP